MVQGRAFIFILLHKPKWVDTVEGEWSRQERTSLSGDASTTLTLWLRNQPYLYLLFGKSLKNT